MQNEICRLGKVSVGSSQRERGADAERGALALDPPQRGVGGGGTKKAEQKAKQNKHKKSET